MPQAKINVGNAEDVIQRGRNVTIVPFDESPAEINSASIRSIKVRYLSMDVANGTNPPNPDSINVNLDTFPSWKVAKYDCANGSCPANPAAQTYVEVSYNLSDTWENAHFVASIVHATDEGAASDEMLFKVESASIVSNADALTPAPITYSLSTGNIVNGVGLYVWKIAMTDEDGKRIMLMGMRDNVEWDWLHDSAYLDSVHASRGFPSILYISGKFVIEQVLNPITFSGFAPFPYQLVAV